MFINTIIVVEWILAIAVGSIILYLKEKREERKEKKDRWLV